ERVTFVSVERLSDARAVLDAIGRQFVAGYSVAMAEAGGGDALLPVKNALLKRQTLLVIDNFESLIALAGSDPTNEEAVREIVNLVHELANVGETWLITTSRETLQTPLDGNELRLGALDWREARELLVNVLRDKGIEPAHEGKPAEEMEEVLTSLIEAVGRHARSLVLLGPNIAGKGIEATRDAIRQEMVALEKQFPEDRERSLLASVRISLSRLDEATRKKIAPLCVFRQAARIEAMAHVLEIKAEDAREMCDKLVALGLADMNVSDLLPDPALREVLALDLDAAMRERAEKRWREVMQALAAYLYPKQFQDAHIALHGARVALIDLLDALDATIGEVHVGAVSADTAMEFAITLESLVSFIGQPRALARVRTVRKMLTELLPEWSHARFNAESEEVERCFEVGDIQAALEMALHIHQQAEAAGDAYPEAAYDRAIASLRLGRGLQKVGRSKQALGVLDEALKRLNALADGGNTDAARMVPAALIKQGDALCDLRQFDAAADKYEQVIQRVAQLGAVHSAAVVRGQLGMVRLQQHRFVEALEAYQQARQDFEMLGERASVAKTWHQIGMVHIEAGQFQAAEHAYKESLRLEVSLGNRAGEASALGQLGTLYQLQDRFEHAVPLHQQAIALYQELRNAAKVSLWQSNL
ncbi:MAG TPA: tetratricopeptide repeat protein, partial [Polyangium sp.]|nr:tetratricopeptide repeat protein [Polyangium sp.]